MRAGTLPVALLLAALASCASAVCENETAQYEIKFANFLSPKYFGDTIPEDGLVFSPVSAFSHSGRISFLTVRGFASPEVRAVAETGDNTDILAEGKRLMSNGLGVLTAVAAEGPTLPANTTTLMVDVNCAHSFVTALSMVAPSPDWIVQISNLDLFDHGAGRFKPYEWGWLIAYDGGTDSGSNFTDPADPSLDIPTMPVQNIAPLVEDETDAFDGRVIGKYVVKMIKE